MRRRCVPDLPPRDRSEKGALHGAATAPDAAGSVAPCWQLSRRRLHFGHRRRRRCCLCPQLVRHPVAEVKARGAARSRERAARRAARPCWHPNCQTASGTPPGGGRHTHCAERGTATPPDCPSPHETVEPIGGGEEQLGSTRSTAAAPLRASPHPLRASARGCRPQAVHPSRRLNPLVQPAGCNRRRLPPPQVGDGVEHAQRHP